MSAVLRCGGRGRSLSTKQSCPNKRAMTPIYLEWSTNDWMPHKIYGVGVCIQSVVSNDNTREPLNKSENITSFVHGDDWRTVITHTCTFAIYYNTFSSSKNWLLCSKRIAYPHTTRMNVHHLPLDSSFHLFIISFPFFFFLPQFNWIMCMRDDEDVVHKARAILCAFMH